MPERVALDTNIVIDLLKKVPTVVDRVLALLEAKTTCLLSPIVVAEVYSGAFKREHKDVEALFYVCQRIQLDCVTGHVAGFYANQFAKALRCFGLEDFLLAATAKQVVQHSFCSFPND